jgi:hypothetical protein
MQGQGQGPGYGGQTPGFGGQVPQQGQGYGVSSSGFSPAIPKSPTPAPVPVPVPVAAPVVSLELPDFMPLLGQIIDNLTGILQWQLTALSLNKSRDDGVQSTPFRSLWTHMGFI